MEGKHKKMNRLDGYKLFHHGVQALSQMEANGVRIDVDYLTTTITKVATRIKLLEANLRNCKEYKLQRKRYGQKVNISSRAQLAAVLFEDMENEATAYTKSGKPQLDEAALERVGTKYTRGFQRLEKLNKLHGTYLTGVMREVEGEYLHAHFGLAHVRSYRGQSDDPNLQNIPKRDPMIAKIIRRAFIPRPGHALVEIDYSSMEVMVACALSGDPKLTHDATVGDMHRDMASEIFILDKSEVTKEIRFAAKNSFVFAEFYGDWYKQVAIALWDSIDRLKLKTKDGQSIYDHLANQNIFVRGACDPNEDTKSGTFEAHIKRVEDRFWNERFRVYKAFRKKQVELYTQQGYIDTVTGFRCMGPMSKNQVLNYHVQGPAFHCLLWSLVTLQKELNRRGWPALLIAQIHDALLADVPIELVPKYVALAKEIMTTKLQAAWPWLSVPLEVETDWSTTNWSEMAPLENDNGTE